MREVNFSIPNSNKASVGITTALYDRRALDCTSTLPLINSLNHLTYLTNSSARIREILTIDGGIERLVSILKNGRTKDMMDTWKWNLAFQCVVNIGVRGSDGRGSDNRGSENIRTRVVEADMVPVIATILDNYMQVVEKLRARQEEDAEVKRSHARAHPSKRHSIRPEHSERESSSSRGDRRRPPAPIHIPAPPPDGEIMDLDTREPFAQTAPADRTAFSRHAQRSRHNRHHSNHRHHDDRQRHVSPTSPRQVSQAGHLGDALDQSYWNTSRDIDGLPSPTTHFQREATSQPETPTTPTAPTRSANEARVASPTRSQRRPALRRQISSAGVSDDEQNEVSPPEDNGEEARRAEPVVGIQDVDMDDMASGTSGVDAVESQDGLTAPDVTGNADTDTFNITHRSIDSSIMDGATPQPNPNMGFSPVQPALLNMEPRIEQPPPNPAWPRHSPDRAPQHILVSVPRDENVIMSLQLLAYVSKYCNLRSYFQQCHLVPKLKIGRELRAFDNDHPSEEGHDEEMDNDLEYCQPNDFNIAPLVEKFTVRHHSTDMKYWAGVVMRNLCRKDKTRGDIRQCAYHKCGKWEAFARQFAKCRRCRQTKYCSKECQKSAWIFHRHWCQPAQPTDSNLQPE